MAPKTGKMKAHKAKGDKKKKEERGTVFTLQSILWENEGKLKKTR